MLNKISEGPLSSWVVLMLIGGLMGSALATTLGGQRLRYLRIVMRSSVTTLTAFSCVMVVASFNRTMYYDRQTIAFVGALAWAVMTVTAAAFEGRRESRTTGRV